MESNTPPPLLRLPSELIHNILSFIPFEDLLRISEVNRTLHNHAFEDTLWQPLVQQNVPGSVVQKPATSSWQQLFRTHHPYWFIPRSKIFFADNGSAGKLVVARYDHRINAIEAYALAAERRVDTTHWEWNPEAIVHTFNPKIKLDLNAPIIRLDTNAYSAAVGLGRRRLQREIPMDVHEVTRSASTASIYSQLMLTRSLPESAITPNTQVWPPLDLPGKRTRSESPSMFHDVGHRPSKLSELNDAAFRIRKWAEYSSRTMFPQGVNVRVGEDVITFATLPESCYTPTPQKPWQGIWCGDYAGHGCEFLVVVQPDDPAPLPERAEWVMRAREGSVANGDVWGSVSSEASLDEATDDVGTTESSEEELGGSFATSGASSSTQEQSASAPSPTVNEDIYRGQIHAIKLTGDPNVPRGEFTFIAPDIGPKGLIRIANEEIFKGARVVKSVGHIADPVLIDDRYITSQLILISPNRLAQYWEAFGHVSFYQRVDIDEFTKL